MSQVAITKPDGATAMRFKHEDEDRGMALGPVWFVVGDTLILAHPVWFTKRQALNMAAHFGLELEEA